MMTQITDDQGNTFFAPATAQPITQVTAGRLLTREDHETWIDYAGDTDITLTVAGGLPAGFMCTIQQSGAGKVTLVPQPLTRVTLSTIPEDSPLRTGGPGTRIGFLPLGVDSYHIALGG